MAEGVGGNDAARSFVEKNCAAIRQKRKYLETSNMSSWRWSGPLAGVLVAASMALVCIGVGDAKAGHGIAWPTRGWQKGAPASVGLDEKILVDLDADFAAGKYALVDSFQVFRCGEEVFERKYFHDYSSLYGKEAKTKGPLNARLTGPYNYFDPFDPTWHPYYQGTDLHSMQSVSKTVTSVILGIAVTRGDFKASLDTPVLKFFDGAKVNNVDDRKRRMTLKDVLTMTSGLKTLLEAKLHGRRRHRGWVVSDRRRSRQDRLPLPARRDVGRQEDRIDGVGQTISDAIC
jgi:hypothetical protein